LSYLGNDRTRAEEVTIDRHRIRTYVKQLFKRSDFPQEVFISLGDSAVANSGDVIWANIDTETPYDFVPIAGIDELVLNLPSKDEFLRELGAGALEDVSAADEARFWGEFEFRFAENAGGVRLFWR
jgi:hypothetical protein